LLIIINEIGNIEELSKKKRLATKKVPQIFGSFRITSYLCTMKGNDFLPLK
jgi:hypothetical protein